ncbi:MAG: acyltransferase [Prevotella sp.]|nr:acyltransferase [Prevotella sp.]
MASEGKNGSIQALRFVFVMMIFMSHFSYRGFTTFEAGGDCGVAFFFLLSGFALSMGYGRSISEGTFNLKRYVRRRLTKVYPLHLLTLALFLVIFRPEINQRLPLNALLLQSWVPDDSYYFSYNGVSWFLSSLLFSYLLFPLAYRHANRRTLTVALIICAIVYIVVPYSQVNALLYVFPPVRFIDFFLGIMLYKFCAGRQPVTTWWAEIVLVLLLILALAVYPFTDAKLRNAPLYWLVLLPFIYVFIQQRGPLSACLQWRVFQWLGSLSMPVFMLHPIVFRTLFHFFPAIPTGTMLALCFITTILLSWATDRLLLKYVMNNTRT